MEQERIDLDALNIRAESWNGSENAICLCPFHTDHHASLSLNVVKGVFLCFSCGAKGNVNKLAKQTGGVVSKKIEFINPKAKRDFDEWRYIIDSPLAYDDDYLKGRNVTNEQVDRFHIHNSPLGIAFPLEDEYGDIIGCLVRRKDPMVKPRYKLFGIYPHVFPMKNLSNKRLFVTEGVFGVLSADRAGIPAVATLSAQIRKESVEALHPHRLFIVFDKDFPGFCGAGKLSRYNPEANVIPGLTADELQIKDWLKLLENIETGCIMYANTLREMAILSKDETKFYDNISKWLIKMKE